MTDQNEERLTALTQRVRGLDKSNYQLRQSNESLTRALGMERAESRSLYDEIARLGEELAELRAMGTALCDATETELVSASEVRELAERVAACRKQAADNARLRECAAFMWCETQLRALLPAEKPAETLGTDTKDALRYAREIDAVRAAWGSDAAMVATATDAPPPERKTPFAWTDTDKAKLVPGATLVVHWEDVGPERETVSELARGGSVRLRERYRVQHEICDPQSIELPAGYDANGSVVP